MLWAFERRIPAYFGDDAIMHLQVIQGDLLDQDVDVIVNAWNRNIIPWWLLLPPGVSGAIKRRTRGHPGLGGAAGERADSRAIQFDPKTDIQVLSPMNRSELGARTLNQVLQTALNPGDGGPEVQRFGWTFRIGDRVIQTENDYDKDVFNGDLGIIQKVNRIEQTMLVNFEGRQVEYDFGDLDELALAYVLSIHKSQGSEFPCVVIPVHTQHYMMLQRNLLYTAVTRGKKLVVLVGTKKALGMAVRRQDTSRRYTALRKRLADA